jgi:lysophospholipase L1-like esterase
MTWYEAEVRDLLRDRVSHVGETRPPVFYGSSSIRLWTTLAEDIGPEVLNLGFGGSTLEACDYYFDRLVRPARPRSILVYAGDNDLGDGHTADQVFGYFRALASKVAALGRIPFGFVSIKPSPARFGIVERIHRTNELIRQYIEELTTGYYVDVYPLMLKEDGKPRTELYTADGLHMNRDGYLVWKAALEPYRHRIFTD